MGAGGTAESSAFTISGDLSYQADYLGDVNYPAHTSACEPLSLNHFAHDVDAHLKMGGDIGLGASGTKVTDVKSDCKNETPAEFLRCTLQVSGLPAGCTAKSSAGPLASSPGGFLVDNFSGYAVNQTKHFDFKLTTTCTPNLAKDVVAILQFKVCADGGFIDPDPCVDTDITPDPSPNVVTKFVTLHR